MSFAQENGHHTHMGHEGHTMSDMKMTKETALLDKALMPKGQPLQELPHIVNKATEAGIFQADLVLEPKEIEIIPNKPTTFWLYNGQLLPLIEIESGTRLKVNIQNNLPQATMVRPEIIRHF